MSYSMEYVGPCPVGDIYYANGIYIGYYADSLVYRSTDLISWTSHSIPGYINMMNHTGSEFIALSIQDDQSVLFGRSTDGITWVWVTPSGDGLFNGVRAIGYADGRYLASYLHANAVSTDGVLWTYSGIFYPGGWRESARPWEATWFATPAGPRLVTPYCAVLYTADYSTWNVSRDLWDVDRDYANLGGMPPSVYGVVRVGAEYYVMIDIMSQTLPIPRRIYKTLDFLTWTFVSEMPFSATWLTYQAGAFMTLSDYYGAIELYTSADAITWTSQPWLPNAVYVQPVLGGGNQMAVWNEDNSTSVYRLKTESAERSSFWTNLIGSEQIS